MSVHLFVVLTACCRLIEDRSADCQVSLDVSVVEIYNNEIFDLLKVSYTLHTSTACVVLLYTVTELYINLCVHVYLYSP